MLFRSDAWRRLLTCVRVARRVYHVPSQPSKSSNDTMRFGLIDRHLLWEWSKIFLSTALGFPVFVTVINITDQLNELLMQGIPPRDIALSYMYSFPENLRLVLPAAVLFATVFTIGSFSRHSELTATKASGRSFHRVILPLLFAATAATGLALWVGEFAPAATRRQMEQIGRAHV